LKISLDFIDKTNSSSEHSYYYFPFDYGSQIAFTIATTYLRTIAINCYWTCSSDCNCQENSIVCWFRNHL